MNDEGRQYQDESETDNLIKRFERMIEENDQQYFDLEEFEAIISHYLSIGLVENAKKVLQYASSLFPENLMLQLREAQILASKGKHIQAIPRLETLLAFEPHNEEIHLSLASIYSQIKEHRYAIKHFKKALQCADPDLHGDIHIDIAIEHQNLGDWRKAISVLKDALYIKPSNESVLFELAFCFDKAGEITAQAFHGDGSQLTGIQTDTDNIFEGDTKVETIDTSSESKIKSEIIFLFLCFAAYLGGAELFWFKVLVFTN